jgi:hypothetical protein
MAKRREAVFSLAEWMPLDEAFAQAKAALGSSALHDLRSRLIRCLPSALRWFENDGTERFKKLKPSFWTVPTMQEGYKIAPDGSFLGFSGEVWVRGLAAALAAARVTAPDNAILYFFVSRRVCNRLYSVVAPRDDAAVPTRGNKRGKNPLLPDELRQRGKTLVRARLAKATTKLENKDAIKFLRDRLKLPNTNTVDVDRRLDRRLIEDIIRPARKEENK